MVNHVPGLLLNELQLTIRLLYSDSPPHSLTCNIPRHSWVLHVLTDGLMDTLLGSSSKCHIACQAMTTSQKWLSFSDLKICLLVVQHSASVTWSEKLPISHMDTIGFWHNLFHWHAFEHCFLAYFGAKKNPILVFVKVEGEILGKQIHSIYCMWSI